MYKFLFNLLDQTLEITKDNHSLVIPEEWKFSYFHSLGFHLDSDQPEHRILFSVCKEKIQVLYKVPQDGSVEFTINGEFSDPFLE